MSTTTRTRFVTLTQVLAFNEHWTDADRILIRQHIESIGSVNFEAGGSTQRYINCLDDAGTWVMTIYPGFLLWPEGYGPVNAGADKYGPWWPLTTSRRGFETS